MGVYLCVAVYWENAFPLGKTWPHCQIGSMVSNCYKTAMAQMCKMFNTPFIRMDFGVLKPSRWFLLLLLLLVAYMLEKRILLCNKAVLRVTRLFMEIGDATGVFFFFLLISGLETKSLHVTVWHYQCEH